MIAALARAAAAFGKPAWLAAAPERLHAFVDKTLRDARRRASSHAWREGRIGAAGMLDDYASMARAALALFEATGERFYLDDAAKLAREAQELFGDVDGSFFLTARDAADVPGGRPRHPHDGATPSGVGLMAEVLVRLAQLTGAEEWRDAATRLIQAYTGAPNLLPQSPLLLAAADFLERGTVVVVAGPLDDPAARPLAGAALASPDPATCVLRTRDGARLGWASPGRMGRPPSMERRQPTSVMAQTCSLPVDDARGTADADCAVAPVPNLDRHAADSAASATRKSRSAAMRGEADSVGRHRK